MTQTHYLVKMLVPLWLLLQPLQQPGVWGWVIIVGFETKQECEMARWDQPYHDWTICAEVKEW